MSAPYLRVSPDEVTLVDVVGAVDFLVSSDARLDPADGGTGVFAEIPGGSPVTRWVVGDGVAGLTLEAADGRVFTLTLTGPTQDDQG